MQNVKLQRPAIQYAPVVVSCALVFYWMLLFAINPDFAPERFSARYWIYVLPAMSVVAALSLLAPAKHTVRPSLVVLLLLLCYLSVVMPLTGEASTLASIGLWLALLMLMLHLRPAFNPSLLNYLLLASVVMAVPTYHAGASAFGYLPGQALSSADQGLQWRVSLFPSLPESAFFSALVVVVNLVHRDLRYRRVAVVVALYFLFFSGIRSALLSVVVVGFYLVATRFLRVRSGLVGGLLFLVALSLFFLAVLLPVVALWVSGFDSQFLNVYLFRVQHGGVDISDFAATTYRPWLWGEHLRLMINSPLTGVGSFVLADMVTTVPPGGAVGTGSESFMTRLLAQVGVVALLLPLALFLEAMHAAKRGDVLVPCTMLMFFVAMFGYGSFLVPYNFLFILLLTLMGGGVVSRPRESAGRHGPTVSRATE